MAAITGRGSPTYVSWMGMKGRCLNPNNEAFARYGGRGISVCSAWLDFAGFLSDMGERPHGSSLDRIDNNGDYEPGNCRWATSVEQARNRRSNRRISIDGVSATVSEWAERSGIPKTRIIDRLDAGATPREAIHPALRVRTPEETSLGCVRGHPYTPDNLYRSPKTGHRFCRACNRAAVARLTATKKAARVVGGRL